MVTIVKIVLHDHSGIGVFDGGNGPGVHVGGAFRDEVVEEFDTLDGARGPHFLHQR